MNNIKHIIWDWNGTLIDDAWVCVKAMNVLLNKRSLNKISLDSYRKTFRFPVIDFYKSLGFNFNNESFEDCGREFIDLYIKYQCDAKLHDDVRNTLENVAKKGIKNHILSASQVNILNNPLDGLINYPFINIPKFNGLSIIFLTTYEEYLSD